MAFGLERGDSNDTLVSFSQCGVTAVEGVFEQKEEVDAEKTWHSDCPPRILIGAGLDSLSGTDYIDWLLWCNGEAG